MTFLLTLGTLLIALIGTVVGNLARLALRGPKQRSRAYNPETGDLVITGVITNGIIATLIALLVGRRRPRAAFLNGLVLTLLLGDQFDRKFLGSKAPKLKVSTQSEARPDPDVAPAVAGHRNGPGTA